MIYLILSILLYSINNYFWKKILSDSNIWFVIALRSSFTIIFGLICSCLIYPELLNITTWHQLKFFLTASLLGALGLICMVSALKKGSLRQLGVFNLLTVFITVTYLIVFENLNIKYYLIGSFFIVIGFAFYLFQIKKDRVADNSIKQYSLLGLMALFFSASGLLHWYNLKSSIPVMTSLLTQESTVFMIGISLFLFQPKKLIVKIVRNSYNKIILVFIMAIIIFLAVWFGFMGLRITNPIISSLLSLAVPVLTIVFGYVFFKEKINSSILYCFLLISIGAFLLYLDLNLNHFYN
jgi:drug/metabolite transporter (DMT)-like permease